MRYTYSINAPAYLQIHNLPVEKTETVTSQLNALISKYITIRIVKELPESVVTSVTNIDELIEVAYKHIPRFPFKIAQYLKDFKTSFQDQLKKNG